MTGGKGRVSVNKSPRPSRARFSEKNSGRFGRGGAKQANTSPLRQFEMKQDYGGTRTKAPDCDQFVLEGGLRIWKIRRKTQKKGWEVRIDPGTMSEGTEDRSETGEVRILPQIRS